MKANKNEMLRVRMTDRQRRWLRFLSQAKGLSESEIVRDLIRKATWDEMQKGSRLIAQVNACLDMKLPAPAQHMSFEDIKAMLDEKKIENFAELNMKYFPEIMADYQKELDYPDHDTAIEETWDTERRKTFFLNFLNKNGKE